MAVMMAHVVSTNGGPLARREPGEGDRIAIELTVNGSIHMSRAEALALFHSLGDVLAATNPALTAVVEEVNATVSSEADPLCTCGHKLSEHFNGVCIVAGDVWENYADNCTQFTPKEV